MADLEKTAASDTVTKDWMIDVLADLRICAMNNNMNLLAEHLDDAILVAASELARDSKDRGVNGSSNKGGDFSGQSGKKPDAR
jgi:hypothetical protein